MEGYSQYCPLAKGAEVFAERWTPLILRELLRGSTTFNDLHRGVPRMSRSLLSSRLRKLESCGVLSRSSRSGSAHYELTTAGREFAGVVVVLPKNLWGDTGDRHVLDHWEQRTTSELRRVLYVGASRAQRLLILAVHANHVDRVANLLKSDAVPYERH